MSVLYAGRMTLPTSNTTPEMLDALVNALRGQVIDDVRIHDAKAEITSGSDFEPVVRVSVLLDNPPLSAGTWSTSTLMAIQDKAWEISKQLGISDWSYVTHIALNEAEGIGWSLSSGGDQ